MAVLLKRWKRNIYMCMCMHKHIGKNGGITSKLRLWLLSHVDILGLTAALAIPENIHRSWLLKANTYYTFWKKIGCLWNCHSPGLRSVKQYVVNTGGVSGCCSCSKSFTLVQESEEAQKLFCLKQTQKYCRVKSWRRRGEKCFFLLWWHLRNARYICAHTERIVANLFQSWVLSRTPHSMKPL